VKKICSNGFSAGISGCFFITSSLRQLYGKSQELTGTERIPDGVFTTSLP